MFDADPVSRINGRRNRAVRRSAGWSRMTDPTGRVTDGDMLQCVHCQFTWIVQEGSDRVRGYCQNCMGQLCGKPECMHSCIPWEKRLENVEAGLPLLTPPAAKVSVPTLAGIALKPGELLIPETAAFELEREEV